VLLIGASVQRSPGLAEMLRGEVGIPSCRVCSRITTKPCASEARSQSCNPRLFYQPETAGGQKGSVYVTMLLNYLDELRRKLP
jgi:hypothetical protein